MFIIVPNPAWRSILFFSFFFHQTHILAPSFDTKFGWLAPWCLYFYLIQGKKFSSYFTIRPRKMERKKEREEEGEKERREDKARCACTRMRRRALEGGAGDIRLVKTVIETIVVCSIWISGFVLLIMTFLSIYIWGFVRLESIKHNSIFIAVEFADTVIEVSKRWFHLIHKGGRMPLIMGNYA